LNKRHTDQSNIQRWDIFCAVIDNYGDIGVSWRLARQLATDFGLQARLWVDDPASLKKLCPELDLSCEIQMLFGVEIHFWSAESVGRPSGRHVGLQADPQADWTRVEPADVVIEAFGCPLPEPYVQAMATRAVKPVWINLEYLSAESWVEGCHAKPSPHPRLPLTKYFFFPGFTHATGGVMAESDLRAQLQAFQSDPEAIDAFWASIGLPPSQPEEIRVSLFGYENAALTVLLDVWAASETAITCLMPEGRLMPDLHAGQGFQRGNLNLKILPFVPQPDYDKLLWACDCNFVRGEDSFVRAQWAAKPFVWHIYPQAEAAHQLKLDAFLGRYLAGMDQTVAKAIRTFWLSWNQTGAAGQGWPEFWRHRAFLELHAQGWTLYLEELGDLASNLVHFCSQIHLKHGTLGEAPSLPIG
jgi:uncharacterized repeat protein (TIGR03837 family)